MLCKGLGRMGAEGRGLGSGFLLPREDSHLRQSHPLGWLWCPIQRQCRMSLEVHSVMEC